VAQIYPDQPIVRCQALLGNPVITSGIQAPKNAHNEIEYKIEINKYFYKVDFK